MAHIPQSDSHGPPPYPAPAGIAHTNSSDVGRIPADPGARVTDGMDGLVPSDAVPMPGVHSGATTRGGAVAAGEAPGGAAGAPIRRLDARGEEGEGMGGLEGGEGIDGVDGMDGADGLDDGDGMHGVEGASGEEVWNEAGLIDDFAVDSNSTDTDSAIEDVRMQSSTASLSSTAYESVLAYGRTYHKYKQGEYMLPNDQSEQNRLDLQHQLSLLTLKGNLHLAPIRKDLHRALDIGTGTGNWAIDFAVKYPSCNVIGCDLSPIQPFYVPPNCHFEVDDVEDDWQYNYQFDYIHGRYLVSCFKDAASVFQKAYDALVPGGYFEMQDCLTLTCIDSSGENTALMRWVSLMLEAATKLGRDWAKVKKYKGWMEEAGFVDIKEHYFAWPTNTWPKGIHHKTVGAMVNEDLKSGLEGFSVAALTRGLGWSMDDVKSFLVDVSRDMDDRHIHAYMPILVVYGRKPL